MKQGRPIRRSELYLEVWAKPMTKVAEGLGMSDRGLSNICQRFDIPTPPRGYWRQLQTGQTIARPSLPEPEIDFEVPLSLRGLPRKLVKAKQPTESASQKIEGLPAAQVGVPPKPELSSIKSIHGFAPTSPSVHFESVVEEFEWAITLTEDINARQKMNDVLGQLLMRAKSEDPATFKAVCTWVEAIQTKLNQTDPIVRCIARISAATRENNRPLWWPDLS